MTARLRLPVLLVAPAAGARAVEPLRAALAPCADVLVHELRGASTRTMAEAAARRIERAFVFGVSLGGMVATWLAADHPGRVERLALASCVPHVEKDAMARAPWVAPGLFSRVRVRWRSVPGLLWAAVRHDARTAVGRISAPTLLLAGADDALFPPDVQRLAWSGLAGARFAVVEGAGHAVSLDRAAEVARLLEEFFGSQEVR